MHFLYLQREGLNGLFFHIVHEGPQESFLFSFRTHSLRDRAQGEQVRRDLTKRNRAHCMQTCYLPSLCWGASSSWVQALVKRSLLLEF